MCIKILFLLCLNINAMPVHLLATSMLDWGMAKLSTLETGRRPGESFDEDFSRQVYGPAECM